LGTGGGGGVLDGIGGLSANPPQALVLPSLSSAVSFRPVCCLLIYGFVDSTVGLCISEELLGEGVYPGRPTRKDSGMSSAPLCEPSMLRLPSPDLKDAGKPPFATCSDPQED
jgi:hypothetical protein